MPKNTIKIDVNSIPAHVRDDLAAATLEFIKEILNQPGGREMLDEKTAAIERRRSQGKG